MTQSVVPRPPLAVIQLGTELECAMTRGWLAALTTDYRPIVFTTVTGAELLDLGPGNAECQAVSPGALGLWSSARRLHQLGVPRMVVLSDSWGSRLMSSLGRERLNLHRPGPAALPSTLDQAFCQCFSRLGVTTPERHEPLSVSRGTRAAARSLLAGIGIGDHDGLTLHAPASAASLPSLADISLPVVLLPPGAEIGTLGELAGMAYFLAPTSSALRAALISRADQLIGDDPLALELAALTATPARHCR